jgi:hypothetical protein
MGKTFRLGRIVAAVAALWLGAFAAVRADEPGGIDSYGGVTATVVAVERGWLPAEPTDIPRAGSEFVTVQVQLDNDSGRPSEFNMFRFTLVTIDGSLWRPNAKRSPYIVTELMPTGQSASGWLTFEVPAGLPLAQLLWVPSFDQRIAIDL